MKFGVDAPWYDDPVEKTAFNLYAISLEEIDRIAKDIVGNFPNDLESVDIEDICYSYNVDGYTAQAIYDRMWELAD